MLYGALPGTGTGKLSVPHQNPGGPSPAGSRSATVTAWPVACRHGGRGRAAGRQYQRQAEAASASQVRLMMPPVGW